ncbi:MAG TPA: hypothetical protein VMT21_08240 [Gemmatimonadales bacterium]|nr:hypothetical protein [Gemmatimonadales bacterium]
MHTPPTRAALIVALALTAPSAAAQTPRAATAPAPSTTCERIAAAEVARYPELQPQDLYKLEFQAALGSAHFVRDTAEARTWLDREARTLGPGPAEPVIDTISPDGAIVRVNLRPYLAAGGDLGTLADAFVRTAHTFRGSRRRLRDYLACTERMARSGRLPMVAAALERYFARMRRAGYPSPEHSARYVAAYHPAYRVVRSDLITAP